MPREISRKKYVCVCVCVYVCVRLKENILYYYDDIIIIMYRDIIIIIICISYSSLYAVVPEV